MAEPPKGWHGDQWSALTSEGGGFPQNRPVECDDCDWTGHESDVETGLQDMDALDERVTPGVQTPVGECPAIITGSKMGDYPCRALVYYSDIEIVYRRKLDILEQIVEATE